MTWNPTLTVITPRALAINLLEYAIDEDRQTDALTWAGGENFKLVKTFSQTIANRAIPVYPSIAIVDDNDAQDMAEDIIQGGYQVTFEMQIQNANPDTAAANAEIYRKAFCSMFVNCPQATLITNSGATNATLQTMETNFDPIKANEAQNDFLQTFQVRLGYSLNLTAYS